MQVNNDEDFVIDEQKREEDRILHERGLDRNDVSPEELDDLVDDARGDAMPDNDGLSDVVPPEESDGND